jgi:hypothetical protein
MQEKETAGGPGIHFFLLSCLPAFLNSPGNVANVLVRRWEARFRVRELRKKMVPDFFARRGNLKRLYYGDE